ncbi:asparagine synthase (glutamine-hydrolyzing) [candidate division KSB1 bacterium]|nr:asparagine synthase (glutamine-hydrolyzing) [candidate division KSB1 bacterium]
MCGICGIVSHEQPLSETETSVLQQMIASLRHRGPDGAGLYVDKTAALGHARLSIIDPLGGQQPLCNEDRSLWLTCNGEIFNYIELRRDLNKRGHRFSGGSDAEVILHLYEECGTRLLDELNGQFAFALWDIQQKSLLLARDPVGICPLYYWHSGSRLAFASEIKALLQWQRIQPRLSLQALMQTLIFWSPLPGQTPFEEIVQVEPGTFLRYTRREKKQQRYWSLSFPEKSPHTSFDRACSQLTDLLTDAVRLRLRSDVPVGAYLSGGLDSSLITALIQTQGKNRLNTFSIEFDHPRYDETAFQKVASTYLGTEHQSFLCPAHALTDHLAQVIFHTEHPILRMSPVPLMLLSQNVHDCDFKVVLTGEGADEFFSGYNIFKETKLRCFHARQPDSQRRPLLYRTLYPYLDGKNPRTAAFWQNFFSRNLGQLDDPFFSHRLRWQNGLSLLRFLDPECLHQLENADPFGELEAKIGADLKVLSPLNRAHYLETHIFLANYLLNSQGERMLMSHSVEGRFPFLDKRVIDFACSLPAHWKLFGLKEKWILKKTFRPLLPEQIVNRQKQPYRAPIVSALSSRLTGIKELLQSAHLAQQGVWHTKAVAALLCKLEETPERLSARDEMALMAILTTDQLIRQFIDRRPTPPPEWQKPVPVVNRRDFTAIKNRARSLTAPLH